MAQLQSIRASHIAVASGLVGLFLLDLLRNDTAARVLAFFCNGKGSLYENDGGNVEDAPEFGSKPATAVHILAAAPAAAVETVIELDMVRSGEKYKISGASHTSDEMAAAAFGNPNRKYFDSVVDFVRQVQLNPDFREELETDYLLSDSLVAIIVDQVNSKLLICNSQMATHAIPADSGMAQVVFGADSETAQFGE